MTTGAEHLDLPITGMTCASCANRVERKLNRLDGVRVNHATEKATVDFEPSLVEVRELLASVERQLLAMIPALQFENWQWLSLQLATPVALWAG